MGAKLYLDKRDNALNQFRVQINTIEKGEPRAFVIRINASGNRAFSLCLVHNLKLMHSDWLLIRSRLY